MCQFTFNTVQDGSCGKVQKGSLLVSFNIFRLLVLILFPHSCKILEPCLEPQIIELELRLLLKKIGFPGSTRLKFEL